jgi:hypothetical protein
VLRNSLNVILKITLILLITLIAIELVLQVVYLNLPRAITQRMPQFQERYGIQFVTSHGAREYPAHEVVDFQVNQYSGDLFTVSCLSPRDAEDIAPYPVHYTRDAHGFRTPNLDSPNANIVIIGDSFTAAEAIVTPYWENLGYSTLALGLPGSGTLEQKRLLDAFGIDHNPKLIVLAFFGGNDVTDNLIFNDLQQNNLTFADTTHQNRNPLEYLVTFHLALFIKDALTSPPQVDCAYPVIAHTSPPTPVAFFDKMLPMLAFDTDTLSTTEIFQITQQNILDIATTASDIEAEFILMYIPQKAEIYWNHLDDETKAHIVDGLAGNPIIATDDITVSAIDSGLTTQRDLLAQLTTDHNLHFLDLTPTLQSSAYDNGQHPYFFSDTHWNQIGHDLVRNVIIEYIAQLTLDKNSDS